jgi:hypothetical protein
MAHRASASPDSLATSFASSPGHYSPPAPSRSLRLQPLRGVDLRPQVPLLSLLHSRKRPSSSFLFFIHTRATRWRVDPTGGRYDIVRVPTLSLFFFGFFHPQLRCAPRLIGDAHRSLVSFNLRHPSLVSILETHPSLVSILISGASR